MLCSSAATAGEMRHGQVATLINDDRPSQSMARGVFHIVFWFISFDVNRVVAGLVDSAEPKICKGQKSNQVVVQLNLTSASGVEVL